MENRELKQQLAELQAAASTPANLLQVDDVVADAALAGPAGELASLPQLVGNGGVVVFLTTTCPYCEQTLPVWSEIAAWAAGRGVPFVAVSLHDRELTAAYADAHALEWPVWVVQDLTRVPEMQVSSVPFTVLVGAGGIVERVWLGALTDVQSGQLRAASEGVLAAASEMSSGSPAGDPSCCEAATSGTTVDG